jgi:predicted nuclease of predicted toxin-antitoxin system
LKLLLDENLSPRLPGLLADLYPGSTQIELTGLRGATDTVVWEYAKQNGYVLVSKDNDFRQRSFQYGAPPKVVWLAVGNAGTQEILRLLRASRDTIGHFVADLEESLLVVTLNYPDDDKSRPGE